MIWVSMLRGVNVGGHNRIKMADLKSLYEAQGFTAVATYIQSGNVTFTTPQRSALRLSKQLADAIHDTFGFSVPVILRSIGEMNTVIAQCPFAPIDPAVDGTKYSVAFLASTPSPARIKSLAARVTVPEKAVVSGREVYLHYPAGTGQARLTNTILEKQLGTAATVRNWKTVLKLANKE